MLQMVAESAAIMKTLAVFLVVVGLACGSATPGDTDLFTDADSVAVEINFDWLRGENCVEINEDSTRWLLNLYSGSCGHCQRFAKTWNGVASMVEEKGANVGVLAINCDTYRDVCTEFAVDSTPKIMAFGVGANPCVPATGIDIGEELEGVVAWIEKNGMKGGSSDGKAEGSGQLEASDDSKSIDNEKDHPSVASLLQHSTAKMLMKQDVMNAVRFGLESGIFLGRHELSGEALGVFYSWINVLRQSFPGEEERRQLDFLLGRMKTLQTKGGGKITSETFDRTLKDWPFAKSKESVDEAGKWHPSWTICAPKLLNEAGHEIMGGYPCALWMLFHVLTVSSATGGASPDLTLSAIYGFVAHFFQCNECRENFSKSNPNPQKEVLAKASSMSVPASRALTLWLWAEHNAVSRRLNDEAGTPRATDSQSDEFFHPVFPTVIRCPSCRKSEPPPASSGGGLRASEKFQKDLEYLSNQVSKGPNAKFRESLLTNPGHHDHENDSSNEDRLGFWDFDATYTFLIHTYCFSDEKLHCPLNSPYSVTADSVWSLSMLKWLILFFFMFVLYWSEAGSYILSKIVRGTEAPKRH